MKKLQKLFYLLYYVMIFKTGHTMLITNYDAYSNGQLQIAWDKIMLLNLTPYEIATHKNLANLIKECNVRNITPWEHSITRSRE